PARRPRTSRCWPATSAWARTPPCSMPWPTAWPSPRVDGRPSTASCWGRWCTRTRRGPDDGTQSNTGASGALLLLASRPLHLALRPLRDLVAGVDRIGAEAVVRPLVAGLHRLAVHRRDGVDHLRQQQLVVLGAHAH